MRLGTAQAVPIPDAYSKVGSANKNNSFYFASGETYTRHPHPAPSPLNSIKPKRDYSAPVVFFNVILYVLTRTAYLIHKYPRDPSLLSGKLKIAESVD